VPYRLTVKICIHKLLTQVNKISVVRYRLLFSIVIWFRKQNLFWALSYLQRRQCPMRLAVGLCRPRPLGLQSRRATAGCC